MAWTTPTVRATGDVITASIYNTDLVANLKVISPYLTTNAQTGTTYTLVLGDINLVVELNNASAITLTVPANASVAFPVGTVITLSQTGAGQVTVVGAGGVTVNGAPGLKLSGQWATAVLIKRATDTWLLAGTITS